MKNGLGQLRAVATTALFFLGTLPVYAGETCRITFASGAVVQAGVARTELAQAKGLSGTTGNLLFVWPDAQPRVFWMKDTPAPLDVAFMDAAGTVFDIQHMKVDSPDAALPVYYFSVGPAQYALELPAGAFASSGISVGDRMDELNCVLPESVH